MSESEEHVETPEKPVESTQTRGWLARAAQLVAIVAGLGAIAHYWPEIVGLFKPSESVSITYLESFEDGLSCLVNKEGLFKGLDKQTIPVVNNLCFLELQTTLQNDQATKNTSISRAVFLQIENTGVPLEKIEIKTPIPFEVAQLESKSKKIVCLGYDGMGGSPSRKWTVGEMKLWRTAASSPKVINVKPKPSSDAMAGASECGRVIHGYPD